ncbi:MAG: sulfite exporter TauE/SafE family protein [Lentisphaeria bacterium]
MGRMFDPVKYGLALLFIVTLNSTAHAAEQVATAPVELTSGSWWAWPLALFAFCFVIGILAPLAGVGGGVLFVPLVSGFFPFHLDYVRGAGLLVAMSGALAAGPALLRRNLANLRLALPAALIASTCSIVGATLGLALPTNIVQILLGVVIIAISILLLSSKNVERPVVEKQDALGAAFGISGTYIEESSGEPVSWKTHRTPLGLLLFVIIGILAGMFGLGAGWANVPVLNLVMGVPLKVTTATSNFLLSMTDTTAAWVYLHNGCVIPLIAIPSIMGLMLGASIGSRILPRAKPKIIRFIVITVLFFAGVKALLKGLEGTDENKSTAQTVDYEADSHE